MEVLILNYLFICLAGIIIGVCIGTAIATGDRKKDVAHAFNEGYKFGYEHGFNNRILEGHDDYYSKYYVRRTNDEKV